MAIRLDVKEYCADCFDFEPYVTRPEKTQCYSSDNVDPIITHQSDTIIRCEYAKRCEGIKRYLERRS